MSNTLKLVIKDINDCLYHIQSWLYSATLDLKKAFKMFCNSLIIVFKAGVNQAVSDTLQLIIKDIIDDCLNQIEYGLYSATLNLEKAFKNALRLSCSFFLRLE